MSMFGFTTRRAAMRRRGGAGSGPVAGTSPTAFAVAPTVQYHPNSQTATLNGSNLVLDCADLKGLAPLLGLAAIPNNRIRNPNMAGAVIGTPGIVPNNWAYATNTTGLTSPWWARVSKNGIPYLDLRVFGTPRIERRGLGLFRHPDRHRRRHSADMGCGCVRPDIGGKRHQYFKPDPRDRRNHLGRAPT
jgi:hypothetical protein